jgi:epoxyqueuosine reductase
MDDASFRNRFRGSPMKRAKLRGLKRNAAVALGNVGTADDVPALTEALGDSETLVSEHARWALARIATGGLRRAEGHPGVGFPPPFQR